MEGLARSSRPNASFSGPTAPASYDRLTCRRDQGCTIGAAHDGGSTVFRIASFNVENLFERPKALNGTT